MKVAALHRYAVKGLSFDSLPSVDLESSRFPDDRRFSLCYENDWAGEYQHKSHFLCRFTAPELLASLQTTYKSGKLTVYEQETGDLLLGPCNLEQRNGRQELEEFLSTKSGKQVHCIDGSDFQFGNTSSGVKNGDSNAQTMHVVFDSTVKALQDKIGQPLQCERFRPNIIVSTDCLLPPFEEFKWIGRNMAFGSAELRIVSKTVRCLGVSVDEGDPSRVLDIPSLLIEHYPEHGPFLGLYCTLASPGTISIGDRVQLLN